MSDKTESPLIVIVGPTASGKSSLAMRLAKEFDGEIISADSRAIFKGLDIGTAKPSLEEQREVPHWGIDLVEPREKFSVKDFQAYAYEKIRDIRHRGKVPLLVGGTGLYIDAVLYSFVFPTTGDPHDRKRYEHMSLNELHVYCAENNIILPENNLNKRYVINTIVRNGRSGTRHPVPLLNSIIVGIATDKHTLKERIAQRAKTIVSKEVFEEARQAGEAFGWNTEAMSGNVYRLIDRNTTFEQFHSLVDTFIRLDWRLAKRQMTWFKRSEHINWMMLEDGYTYCARILAKLNKS